MRITQAQQKQNRLLKLSKGVSAAAQLIDGKFREAYGDPRFIKSGPRAGSYSPVSPYRVALITLTYARDGMWEPQHISALIKNYREWFRRNAKGKEIPECHYVWVMELTEIGRPHYHIVMWMPRGVTPPFPDEQGWWPHGMTQAKFAHSPVGYIVKYASKLETKSGIHVPKKARLWGYGGPKMAERGQVAFANAPRWLKGVIHHESFPRKKRMQVNVEKTMKGQKFQFKTAITAWVLTAGICAGYAFVGPYEADGFASDGLVLRHRGHIDLYTPDGDFFVIQHKG